MDNKKIGKLIADLRKKNGLTQQELGDKVGVGFRAVSKWERGITLPDITIINEVSKILGISSDELLSGEIKKENKEKKKKKVSLKLKITLLTIITITIIFASILAYYNNKTYTYTIESISNDYYVEGKVVFEKDNTMIIVNKLNFTDENILATKIKNYEYQINSNEEFILGYGQDLNVNILDEIKTIKEFCEKFRVNYSGEIYSTRKELLENNFVIKMEFITEDNQLISKEIEVKLTRIEK